MQLSHDFLQDRQTTKPSLLCMYNRVNMNMVMSSHIECVCCFWTGRRTCRRKRGCCIYSLTELATADLSPPTKVQAPPPPPRPKHTLCMLLQRGAAVQYDSLHTPTIHHKHTSHAYTPRAWCVVC
jgi:hypothetical protein